MARIALVSQSYAPVVGGVGEHVRHLARELLLRGHDVTVITGAPRRANRGDREGPEEIVPGAGRVVRVGKTREVAFNGATVSLVLDPGALPRLARLGRSTFDLVHVHSPFEPLLPIAAVATFRAPIVATFHSAGRCAGGYRPFLPLLAAVARRLSVRIAVSRTARDHVSGLFPGDYRIVPNGVDPAEFGSTERARAHGRPLRVLAVGRLDPRKGHGVLLRAAARLRGRTVPPWELRIVGDGPLRSRLEKEARERELPVTFLGSVPDPVRAREYREADLFVAPATHGESFGVVLLEAMSAGLPILASDLGGYREVLGARAACVARAGVVGDWALALARLLRDDAERRRLAEAGRLRVERFAWPRVVDELEDVYAEARGGPVRDTVPHRIPGARPGGNAGAALETPVG